MVFPWGTSRRYNAYADYFRSRYGGRVQKLTIDAGFSCPNRDGTVSTGGCAYCNNRAFNPSYCAPEKSIRQQLEEGIIFHEVRYRRAEQYLAYFQAFSNTHAPVEKLREIYHDALSVPRVAGLVIGTRPDCIDEEKLALLAEIARQYYVMVEYGIESCYDRTLQAINRGHTAAVAFEAVRRTAAHGIHTGAHLIFGLPGESHEEMLDEIDMINQLPLTTVKFHQLQIVKDTPYAARYAVEPEYFHLFGLEEYLDFMVDVFERLNPAFIVERFANEVPPWYLAAPGWGLIRNFELWLRLEKKLEERDTWQGRLYRPC